MIRHQRTRVAVIDLPDGILPAALRGIEAAPDDWTTRNAAYATATPGSLIYTATPAPPGPPPSWANYATCNLPAPPVHSAPQGPPWYVVAGGIAACVLILETAMRLGGKK